MRKYQNINKKLESSTLSIFPNFESIVLDDGAIPCIYNEAHISVFNHWLSVEEADKEITDAPNDIYNQALHNFSLNLFKQYQAYFVKFKGNDKKYTRLKVAINDKALEIITTPTHHLSSGQFRFVALIPELEVLYLEGCDYTHHIYYKSEPKFNKLKTMISEYGLYVLR